MTSDVADVLAELAHDHPGWKIWRGRPSHDREPSSWCATLHDTRVGVTPTLVEPTPGRLRAQLEVERARAARGDTNAIPDQFRNER